MKFYLKKNRDDFYMILKNQIFFENRFLSLFFLFQIIQISFKTIFDKNCFLFHFETNI